ncbi:MAG: hypothetical protein LUQ11_12595 [Methylococcaceae bacterium]|nr:hypothetical protein [Methylococcaceae bacterium]
MMELDSALVILMAEVLVVMIALALTLFFIGRNRRHKELAEIEQFINRMGDEELLKSRMLETILVENCGIDGDAAAMTLREVSDAERALLQRIIQLFLERNPALLSEIDQLIANLSDPYCKLLAGGSATVTGGGTGAASGSGSGVDNKIAGLERINQQLVRQLDTAMKTIDEITAEYTRVFSGNQTALELENSSKKMQQIFQDVERNIKSDIAELEG